MGRVRNAAAVFEKIRQKPGIWPLDWQDIIALIEYQQLCLSGEERLKQSKEIEDARPR